ncbi:zinc dependent phospholipase C family protein [Mucilaginibacter sp. HMF5004]|uniref:zinc dependent phospholipase C family protein n=1 Tax=Mucilaginibacter rivuli TaxID=2857527 RepID=UPI001C5F3C13|nr:zinc dependent phospholipase C family protein [Mucilaginibacter rivuli]MBW4889451.1 zinc dependent phospholipase C family protein [Mucilaginibacter rivuli]
MPSTSKAFSVLTHEALVDASWDKYLKPLLKEKFPASTDEQLKQAHSYAYGGCLIADMGYFPFGSTYYTNLAHYVRSGDFVNNLIAEAQNINEYAFALGALSHYMADKYGHSMATNVVVPLLYPKIKKKFGDVVTYEDDHISHSRTELSFDVLQTAKGNYATQAYHDFIGFNVAKSVLERAFLKTYGENMNEVFKDLDLTISTYRWAVKSLLPGLTHAAWAIKKNEIKRNDSTATGSKFHYRMNRRKYYEEFGTKREKLSFKARVFAFIIKVLPKVGPLKVFKFKDAGPEGEKIFIKAFDTMLVHYATAITTLRTQKTPGLIDIDFDTGQYTRMGEYELADETYSDLVLKLEDNKYIYLTKPLQQNILDFFNNDHRSAFMQKEPDKWKKTILAVDMIKTIKPIPMDSLRINAPATAVTQK